MKSLLLVISFISTQLMYAQQANLSFTLEDRSPERIALLKSSLVLHETDENLYWPLYAQYEQRLRSHGSYSFFSLNSPNNTEFESNPIEYINSIFETLKAELALKKEYFDKMNMSLNGTIAFQFLQSESLLDLILKSKLYESLNWNQPQWNNKMIKDEKLKLSVMEFTLGLSAEDRSKFIPLYEDYEFEYSRVVGHEYVWFEQYVEDIENMIPAQGKRMGRNFLNMQQKEILVREKFFTRISETMGADFAARFMALEDYFSMMAKLKTWSDSVRSSR